MPAPVASGWSDRRVGLAPTGKAPPCHGAHGKPTFAEAKVSGEMRRLRTFPFSRETGRFDTKLPFATAKHLPPVTPLETFNGTVLKRCVLVPLPMPLSARAAGLCGSALA